MGQSSLEIFKHLTGNTLRYGHRRIPLPLQTFLREVKQMPRRLATSFSGSPKYCCSSSNPIVLCAGISRSLLRQMSTRSRRLNPLQGLQVLALVPPSSSVSVLELMTDTHDIRERSAQNNWRRIVQKKAHKV